MFNFLKPKTIKANSKTVLKSNLPKQEGRKYIVTHNIKPIDLDALNGFKIEIEEEEENDISWSFSNSEDEILNRKSWSSYDLENMENTLVA